MATYMGNDVVLTVNSVDLSAYVKKATLDESVNELDDTTMGDTTESRKGGLKRWTLDVEFLQDHTGSSVEQTIRPLLGSTTTVTLKPTSSSTSTTNPNFSGTALVAGFRTFDATVGDLVPAAARFVNAGTLSRLTT